MNSYSILIVEDEIDIARAIEAYLNNQGYKTFIAGNGIEGLDILATEEINCSAWVSLFPKYSKNFGGSLGSRKNSR